MKKHVARSILWKQSSKYAISVNHWLQGDKKYCTIITLAALVIGGKYLEKLVRMYNDVVSIVKS